MIEDEEFVELVQVLSPAELRDWIAVEVLGYGVREWSRKITRDDQTVPHQSISRNLRNARRKIDRKDTETEHDVT